MVGQWILRTGVLLGVIWAGGSFLRAQQTPDTILYNGKIVTVDNHEVSEDLGTIAEALAIRGDTILAVGSNAQVRALAGGNTKSIDLQGRMVTPGYGGTHDHPMDWDTINPFIVKKVVTDDMHIERFLNTSPDETIRQFPQVLDEAVQKAKPGQWIRISLLFGKEYRWGREIMQFFGRQINKQMLDLVAPDNPVQIRGGFTGMVVNQKAIDLTKQFYGDQWEAFVWNPYGDVEITGVGGTAYRWLEQDVLYPQEVLQEIYRLGFSWMAGYGVTLNASGLYTPGAVAAYHALDERGELVIRMPWSWQWRPRPDLWSDPYLPKVMAGMLEKGSDHLWLTGLWPSDNGANCSTLPGTSPEVKEGEVCHFSQDYRTGENATALYNMVKAGGRLSGIHTGGDRDIDLLLDTIEKASEDAGMSLDQIRAKRHAYDHMGMSPRPDQITRIKNLGMIVGGYNLQLWEGGGERLLANYGEQAVEWMQPRKNLLDAGVMNSVEIDRPIGYTDLTYFTVLYAGITRKDQNGKVWGPRQAISREAMLKFASLGGAYYAKREDKLGSLEPGKWADLVVLDRDYLTIPVDDILNVRVMMTMVGGEVVHLVPSMAREIGMQPTGAQVELGGPAAQW